MFYPQGNFTSPGNLAYPPGGYPQGSHPQGAFGSAPFGSAQGGFGHQGFGQFGSAIPFANTFYGYPHLTPHFAQNFAASQPQVPNWQHLAQLQQQAALQQQALLQQLAPQLAAHSLTQLSSGIGGINSSANGAGQPTGGWQQSQVSPEQINATLLQQPQQQLQRLAQYHQWVAQQFAQLAAQQAVQNQNFGNPYAMPYAAQFIPGGGQFPVGGQFPGAGQFVPNQVGGSFVPGITMH